VPLRLLGGPQAPQPVPAPAGRRQAAG